MSVSKEILKIVKVSFKNNKTYDNISKKIRVGYSTFKNVINIISLINNKKLNSYHNGMF